jgi:hypothetical protein
VVIDFEDTCWSSQDPEWQRGLVELLTLLANRSQHSLLATPGMMLTWCAVHLHLHVDYFKTRLASAQVRANALKIRISPTGNSQPVATPPWNLTARAAYELVNLPLRLVLENDQSDRMFVESTVSSFAHWCTEKWILPAMGGGSTMQKDIISTSADITAKWRTFYLFDSDRLHPNELSNTWTPPSGDGCQGYAFEVACANLPSTRWHRLDRRSIENYLPESTIAAKDPVAASILFDISIGNMADFYNFKLGLSGDGISPIDPKKTVRSARSQGFWHSLSATSIHALQSGFGKSIADEFQNVPENHPWPPTVIAEMNALSDALQDAM